MVNVCTQYDCERILVEPRQRALIACQALDYSNAWVDRTYQVERQPDGSWVIEPWAGTRYHAYDWGSIMRLITSIHPIKLEILES